MERIQGYVVVQKTANANRGRFNPYYRGVDRLVPWSVDIYGKGFRDPYLSPRFTTDDGFILALELAKGVLAQYAQIMPVQDLDILYITRTLEVRDSALSNPALRKLLGIDVANNGSPFYSIVYDFPPPTEHSFLPFRRRLNENGLFDALGTAEEYPQLYVKRYPEEAEHELVKWYVYIVSA